MASNGGSPLPWAQPGWRERTGDWIQAETTRLGLRVNGPIEQPHVRPWSTVLRVPTSSGDLYFKATAPTLAHEPALTQALARWRPDCMPQVLAVDPARGWMLMRDGGATLRSLIKVDRDLGHWHRALPLYAGLQIEMADRRDDLLALGALDRRLAALPAQYDRLLADTPALRIDRPDGLTSDEVRRLRALAPRYAELCGRLAAFGLPETLHHDDFHDANIFVRGGRYVFFDWGESGAAHPFFTLLVTLRSVANTLGLDAHAREVAQLRDVYLASWTRFGTPGALRAAFDLAQQVGMVARALTWHHVVSPLPGPAKQEYAGAVPGWLQEFLTAVETAGIT